MTSFKTLPILIQSKFRHIFHFSLVFILCIQFIIPAFSARAMPPIPGDPLSPPRTKWTGDEGGPQQNPDSLKRIIVQLVGRSTASFAATGKPIQGLDALNFQAQMASQQGNFLTTLHSKKISASINRQFEGTLFNGIAMTVSSKDISKLEQINLVAGIYPDDEVHSSLNESVPLIGAPAVWALSDSNNLPVDGRGMRVAIIDTGIDYTHPDLGGGFGPGYKVEGGYDFVNNDSNPMDDNGHGTHVAGIVAANGTLKGVAPGADLLAYKALDFKGIGFTSDIISALEKSVDPDGNPATNDAVDVINLSLGGTGNPASPMSQAVDNAVSLGVVVVVAAGNYGDEYMTIGSPGNADKAITVAATDKSDNLAAFSSRGPIFYHPESLKPDIAAPGVNILSTVPLQGQLSSPSRYLVLSGTSMAAPHVAGAAALVRQMHPTWTPDQVKASLTTSATPLINGPFEVGAGRLQVDKAMNVPLLITPNSLGFGISIPDQTIASSILNVYNPGTEPTSATISVSVNFSAYLNFQSVSQLQPVDYLKVNQTSISLNPGASSSLQIKLKVPSTASDGYYTGLIQLSLTNQTLSIPVAFSVKKHLDLSNQPAGVVGQIGGAIEGITADGNYVYIGSGPRMKIYDVSTPAKPKFVGQTAVLPGVVNEIQVAGSYAYIADGKGGFQVVDITDKSLPTRVGSFSTENQIQEMDDIVVSGNYAYLTDYWTGLDIIDISIPTTPHRVGFLSGNSFGGLDVSGNYAYVATAAQGSSGLEVINIHQKTTPFKSGFLNTTGVASSVAVKDNYAYVMEMATGLRAVNITDPTLPVDVGGYTTNWTGYDMQIAGNLIYISNWVGSLNVFDISQPNQPVKLIFHKSPGDAIDFNSPGYSKDTAIIGNYAYTACDLIGLCVADFSDPSSPREIAEQFLEIPGEVGGVAYQGSYAQIGNNSNNLVMVDVSHPDDPIDVAAYYDVTEDHYTGSTNNLVIAGDYTYLAESSGLRIVKNSSAELPLSVGFLATASELYGVAVSGNTAYAADLNNGLRVIDVTDKTNPVQVGFYSIPSSSFDVATDGSFAYVVLNGNLSGISIIDVTNKTSPHQAGYIDLPGGCESVIVAGNYAYVSNLNRGLQILDVSNKSNPKLISSFNSVPGPHFGMALNDRIIYMTEGNNGISMIDVSDTTNPQFVAQYKTSGYASHIAVTGDYAFVDDRWGGLSIVKAADSIFVTSISNITPSFIMAGSSTFTIDVIGNRFVPGETIDWNGVALITTYKSSTHLEAQVPFAAIQFAGTEDVTVCNSQPGGGCTDPLIFQVWMPFLHGQNYLPLVK
jgi:hypothetical protein